MDLPICSLISFISFASSSFRSSNPLSNLLSRVSEAPVFCISMSTSLSVSALVLMWSLLAVLVSDFRCCFTLCLFIILLVQFGLLSGHLLGNSCPLGKQFVLLVFCLFVILIYFPLWFWERDLPFDCSISCSLLFCCY